MQSALNLMGFDTGGVDGNFGPKTRQAVRQARAIAFLEPGDEVDVALLSVLPNVPAMRGLQSDHARAYSEADISEDLEPRLRKALHHSLGRELRFGYFDGHLYLAFLTSSLPSQSSSFGWDSANDLATRLGGHLATIQSGSENAFLVSLFSTDPRFYRERVWGDVQGPSFGLYQPDQSREPAGGWEWVTGEPLTFTAWAPGSPNNGKGREHYARFVRPKQFRSSGVPVKYWDDEQIGRGTGFIIEIE